MCDMIKKALETAARSTKLEYSDWYSNHFRVNYLIKYAFSDIANVAENAEESAKKKRKRATADEVVLTDEQSRRISECLSVKMRIRDLTEFIKNAPKASGHWVTECSRYIFMDPPDSRKLYEHLLVFPREKPARGFDVDEAHILLKVIKHVSTPDHASILDALSVVAIDSIVFECFDETRKFARILSDQVSDLSVVRNISAESESVILSANTRITEIIKFVHWMDSIQGAQHNQGQRQKFDLESEMFNQPSQQDIRRYSDPRGIVLVETVSKREHVMFPDEVDSGLLEDTRKCITDGFDREAVRHSLHPGQIVYEGKLMTRPRACVAVVDLELENGGTLNVFIRQTLLEDLRRLYTTSTPVVLPENVGRIFCGSGIAVSEHTDDGTVVYKFNNSIKGGKICVGRSGK